MNIIETSDLMRAFNGMVAVDKINFSVKKGEIFGFLGPNGAGKTTTINMLITLLPPTSGTATVNSFDIVKEPNRVRESIGVVPQNIVLENELTARENLEFHGAIYGVPKEQMDERIPKLLELVELTDRADSRVKTFSGGMKRRLEIVKAFLHHPTILFMDEPTQALDPQTRRVIWDYITNINKNEGTTIFLTTHYMEEADTLCDRISIIDYGKILDIDTPSNMKGKIGKGDLIDIKLDGSSDAFVKAIKKKCECEIKIQNEDFLRIHALKEEIALPKIVKIAEENGVTIKSVSVREPTLEDVFIHYTGRAIRDEKGESMSQMFVRRMKG